MKKIIAMTLGSIILLTGCMNEFKFRADKMDDEMEAPGNEINRNPPNTGGGSPKPNDPPLVIPDHPSDPVVYKQGACSKEKLDVLPCLSCQISQRPIDIPWSVKAAQLAKIMEHGCATRNGSDPPGYRPPSRSELVQLLSRASQDLYPETPTTARQKFHLEKWLENDKTYIKKLFGGLFYNPPYSNDFETYFGLELKEARLYFCYHDSQNTFSPYGDSDLYSVEYYQCMHENHSSACKEKAEYIAANKYRDQLIYSIYQSIHNPFNDQELVPVDKCQWVSMAGNYNVEMETTLIDWKNKGYEISVSFETDRSRCEPVSLANISMGARVTIAGKLCTDF